MLIYFAGLAGQMFSGNPCKLKIQLTIKSKAMAYILFNEYN